jgi:probable rRNA maturation factor
VNQVHIRWQSRPSRPAAGALRTVIMDCLSRLEISDAEVHVVITDDDTVRELNRHYRNSDRATDVLSFADGDVLPTGRLLLGEIVISLDTARRQATKLGHDEVRELSELVLHGTLHLLGYDHERDNGTMKSTELRLREELLP